jgi:predicted aspartyl protease
VQEKPCLVSIDTGASATVARPDIVAGLPERELNRPYVLQTTSGETIPVVKEAHVELTMGRRNIYVLTELMLANSMLESFQRE